jgi:hypothetical protein
MAAYGARAAIGDASIGYLTGGRLPAADVFAFRQGESCKADLM